MDSLSESREAIRAAEPSTPSPVPGDSRTSDERETGAIRICLLGSQGAGKTCLLAGLAILGEPDRSSPFQVTGADPETQSYLNELARTLRSQEWPPPTNRTRLLRLDIRFRGRLMLLHVLDYLGEHFQSALNELDYENVQELREHMLRADALLLLVDPLTDLLARHAPHPAPVRPRIESGAGSEPPSVRPPIESGAGSEPLEGQLSSEDKEQILARLSALQNSLSEVFKERRTQRAAPGNPLPDTAILLTKSDQVRELRAGENPNRYLKRLAPAFYARIAGWAHRVRCFAVTVPGYQLELLERPADATLKMPPPPFELHPSGYEELFHWIIRSRDRSKRRPLLRRLAFIGVPLLLVSVLGIGATLYEQDFRKQQRDAIERALSQEVDKLEARLSAATSGTEIDDIVARLHELDDRARSSRGASASIGSLSSQAMRKKEEIDFNQVQDAHEAQDQERYAKLAQKFLRDFSTGARARQVREWLEEGRKRARQQDRDQIRSMPSTGPQTLREKAARIEEHTRRYPEDPDLHEMARAARLARSLADGRSYSVQLRSAGLFTKQRKFAVVVELNQEELQRFDSVESARAKTWDRASFQLDWKPGDRVRLRLEDLYLGDETVASLEEQGPLSLRLLSGKQTLEKIETGWEDHLQGDPYLHFDLKGFTGEDWELLHRYVHPGDQW